MAKPTPNPAGGLGTVLPACVRELREQARRPANHRLRLLAAAIMVAAAGLGAFNDALQIGEGRALFATLQYLLFLSASILVPLMTADCISRERREGTLGLLLLTPLKPRHIVLAKGLTHALRAATLLAAAFPVMAMVLLLGGVSGRQVLGAAILDACALTLGLSAGLLASAQCVGRTAAMVTSMLWFLAALVWLTFAMLAGMTVIDPTRGALTWSGFLEAIVDVPVSLLLNQQGGWKDLLEALDNSNQAGVLLQAFCGALGVAILTLAVVHLWAARSIARHWREAGPSWLAAQCRELFCAPVYFQSFFKRWLRRSLERNPVGWLERRSWTSRALAGAWLLVVTAVVSVTITYSIHMHDSVESMLLALAALLAGSMAFSAAGSFHRERESGLLELLLVAPLREWQILFGRLRAIWGQFLPACGLLLWAWASLGWFVGVEFRHVVPFLVIVFVALPVIGLYFSLRSRQVLTAFVWTLLVGAAIPLVAGLFAPAALQIALNYLIRQPAPALAATTVVDLVHFRDALNSGEIHALCLAVTGTVLEIAAALVLACRLESSLKLRRFAFHRA